MKKKKSLTGLIITLMVGWVFLMDQRDYSDREYLTTISFIVRSSSMEFRMMKKLDNFKRNCLVRGGGSKHAAACDPLRVAPYVSEIMQIMPVLEGAHPGFEDVLIQELEKNNHDGVKDLRVMALKLYVENLEDVRAKYKRRTAVLHAAFFLLLGLMATFREDIGSFVFFVIGSLVRGCRYTLVGFYKIIKSFYDDI